MKQVLLQLGTTKQIVWIPEKFASSGKFLEIKGENGWKVMAVYGKRRNGLETSDGRGFHNLFGSLNG